MYTVSSLKAANPRQLDKISENEVAKVNSLVELLEQNFHFLQPTPGDLIICHGYSNYYNKEVVYPHGLINEVFKTGSLTICVEPMTPYISASGRLNTSGGYWFACSQSSIKRSQSPSATRTFWCWGKYGPCAHGGLYFQARVKAWEVTSCKVY